MYDIALKGDLYVCITDEGRFFQRSALQTPTTLSLENTPPVRGPDVPVMYQNGADYKLCNPFAMLRTQDLGSMQIISVQLP